MTRRRILAGATPLHRVAAGAMLLTAVAQAGAENPNPIEAAVGALRSLFGGDSEGTTAQTPRSSPPYRNTADQAYRSALGLRDRGDAQGALTQLRRAAGDGHAAAAYELGMLYMQGRTVEKDLDAASRWLNLAADRGNARAQFLVGASLMSGAGVQRDAARGIGFLALAGEAGHARAQNLLGQAYVDGVGVPANPAWAARWYGRAARAGHVDAQYAYGVMRASGLGLPRDTVDAYRWLHRAATAGHARARALARRLAGEIPAAETAGIDADRRPFTPSIQNRLDDAPTVMFVQRVLDRAGFAPGPVDGLMGPRTRSAMAAFRRASSPAIAGTGLTPRLLERLVERAAALP